MPKKNPWSLVSAHFFDSLTMLVFLGRGQSTEFGNVGGGNGEKPFLFLDKICPLHEHAHYRCGTYSLKGVSLNDEL